MVSASKKKLQHQLSAIHQIMILNLFNRYFYYIMKLHLLITSNI